MAFKELKYIVENLQDRANMLDFSIKKMNSVLFEILKKKGIKFEEFKNNIQLKWEEFEKKNQNRVIKKTFTSFFYENFHDLFNTLPFLKLFASISLLGRASKKSSEIGFNVCD